MRLNFQVSDYDSASTSLLNSLMCLYKKDEVPLVLVKAIYLNSLDLKPKIIGECASSKWTMRRVCFKFKNNAFKYNLDVNYVYLCNKEVNIKIIKDCIDNNGVVIVRSKVDVVHYYLITNMDEKYVYIWDPAIYSDTVNNYNIVLRVEDIDNDRDINYSLGPLDNREIILALKSC